MSSIAKCKNCGHEKHMRPRTALSQEPCFACGSQGSLDWEEAEPK